MSLGLGPFAWLVAAGAGAALPFAFAPYGLWPLAIVTLGALFGLWQGGSPRRAAGLGYVFGVGMFGHGVWWIQVSIHKFGLPIYTFSVSMTALFVLFMALYPALIGYLVRRLPAANERARLLLLMPALWVLGEWLRGWLLTGFPWLLLGYSQVDSWLAGYAPLGGVHAASIAVALMASFAAFAVHAAPVGRLTAFAGLLAVAAGGFALSRMDWTRAVGEPALVALVQGAVPQEIKWRAEYRAPTLELYQGLSAPHWGKSVVIWPETALPAFPGEIRPQLESLAARAKEAGTALLVGMPTGNPAHGVYFNSVVLMGEGAGQYDKHHLVPFGEFLPIDRWLRPILDFLTIPMSSFSRGPEIQAPLAAGVLRFGVSICYEDAYASEVRKAFPAANLLVNVSDDAWFGDTIAPHQHLEIARMRALESGRYLLRATNTGVSAIIDGRGRVLARSPQFEPYVLTGEAEAREGATPFVRTGHWPVLLVAATMALVSIRLRRKGPEKEAGAVIFPP